MAETPKFAGRPLEPEELKLLNAIRLDAEKTGDWNSAQLLTRVIESAKYTTETMNMRERTVSDQSVRIDNLKSEIHKLTMALETQKSLLSPVSINVDRGSDDKLTAVLIEKKENGVLKIVDIFQK